MHRSPVRVYDVLHSVQLVFFTKRGDFLVATSVRSRHEAAFLLAVKSATNGIETGGHAEVRY